MKSTKLTTNEAILAMQETTDAYYDKMQKSSTLRDALSDKSDIVSKIRIKYKELMACDKVAIELADLCVALAYHQGYLLRKYDASLDKTISEMKILVVSVHTECVQVRSEEANLEWDFPIQLVPKELRQVGNYVSYNIMERPDGTKYQVVCECQQK